MNLPKKIGDPRLLFAPIWRKSAVVQKFLNPRTRREYDYVIFQADCGPATVVFGLTEKQEVIAVRQFRHGSGEIMLELPGGVFDEHHSSPCEAARVELLEETGYAADSMIQLTPNPIYFDPASWTMRFIPFLALDCAWRQKQKLDAAENIEVAIFTVSNWTQAIADGNVRDAKSIATTYLALEKLHK